MKRKLALYCDVDQEAVVSAPDAPSIYDIPKVLHREGLDAYVVRRLGLSFRDVDWTAWDDLLERVHHPEHEVTIALVGKYIDLPDAYLSVSEAIRAAGFGHRAKVKLRWVPSDDCADRRGRGQGAVARGRRGDPGRLRRARASRARSARSGTPGRTGSRPWACAWACSAWRSRWPGDVAGIAGASSLEFDEQHPGPDHLHHGRPGGHRRRQGRPGRHHAAGRLPGEADARARSWPRPTARPRSPSGTGTGTRSTTPTGTR